ncbi:hypothetical protein B7494_g3853 [Chlorociboria aeruginascens]|nr:hypothetical protein B7494_g3853 [Chlorociboria aeruginascens]
MADYLKLDGKFSDLGRSINTTNTTKDEHVSNATSGIHVFSSRVACLQGCKKKLPRPSKFYTAHSDSNLGPGLSRLDSLLPHTPKLQVESQKPRRNPPTLPVHRHRPYIGSSPNNPLHSESSGIEDRGTPSPSDLRALYRAADLAKTRKEGVPPSTPKCTQRWKPHTRQLPLSPPPPNHSRPGGPRDCPPSTPTRNIPRLHRTSPFSHARLHTLDHPYSLTGTEENGPRYRRPNGPGEMLGETSNTSKVEMRTRAHVEVINGIAEDVRLSRPSNPSAILNTTTPQSSPRPRNPRKPRKHRTTLNYIPHRVSPIAEATSEDEATATKDKPALA